MASSQITVRQAHELMTALGRLDGYQREVGGKIIQQFYQLGAARLDIAINMNRLRTHVDGFEKARVALINELSNGTGKIDEAMGPPWQRFKSELDAMMEKTVTIDLSPLPRDRLKLDENPIPLAVLATLSEHGLITESAP